MIPLNYHHLYYFYTIAREGSISAACRGLHLSQPALSTQLKQFEKSMGLLLFERDGRRLKLTEQGRVIFEYASRMFSLANEMRTIVQAGGQVEAVSIRMGVVSGMPRAFSKALINYVLRHHPGTRLQLQEASFEDLLGKLETLQLDIALTETAVAAGEGIECESRHVGKIPLVFAAAPKLARKFKMRIRDHIEVPFILPTNPTQVYSQVRDLLASGRLAPKIIAEVQDVDVARLLAIEEQGIAPVNAFSLTATRPQKGLVAVDWIFPEPIYENLYLVARKRHFPNPVAKSLLERFHI